MKKILIGISAGLLVYVLMFAFTIGSRAETLPTVDFENPPYTLGNINGQNGWMKTGAYDVEVEEVADFPNAVGYGFELQALRLSNAVTSGAFGDQTFSPGLASPAGETGETHFEASFSIGSTLATQQPGLFTSVSPDDGNGSRMSYVGFDDQADGIHVIFYDVTNPGPLPTVATFNFHDVATINRTSAHTIKFVIDFVAGPANDVVKLYVDNTLVFTGTTWEDYYRYDPEQTGNGNLLFPVSKLLFREGGASAPLNSGNGYLIDNVSLLSGVTPTPEPTKVNLCHKEKKGSDRYHLISVSENAVPAHLKHGDVLAPEGVNENCEASFEASDSLYYNGLTEAAGLYGTGPISFTWNAVTGVVTGGLYEEIVPPVSGTHYFNEVTGGSVVGGVVNLTFTRTVPSAYGPFTFTGNLVGNVLTGQLDGPYLFITTGN